MTETTGTVEVGLPGTGWVVTDLGAELLFRREFEAEFARLMIEWWTADPDALAVAFPTDADTAPHAG